MRFLQSIKRVGELHRDFHSTPDLAASPPPGAIVIAGAKPHRSQEDVTILGILSGRAPLRPPPMHPPPPPPVGQLVVVDISRASKSEYDILTYKGKLNVCH